MKYGVIDKNLSNDNYGEHGDVRQHIVLEGEVEGFGITSGLEEFEEVIYDKNTNLTYLPLVFWVCREYNETQNGVEISYFIEKLDELGFERDDSILKNLEKGKMKLVVDGDIDLKKEDFGSIRVEFEGFDREDVGDCAELVIPYPSLIELTSKVYVEDDMLIPEDEDGMEALIKFSLLENVEVIEE